MDSQGEKRSTAASVPYRSGYRFSAEARPKIKAWLRTNLMLSVVTALVDHASIILIAFTHIWIGSRGPWIWMVTYGVAVLLIARQQRALETLIHEGSHQNWCRSSRRYNDLFVNALAAFPMFSSVAGFRADHAVHHARIGTDADPCFRRYMSELDLNNIDRSSLRAYMGSIAARLGSYVLAWWTGPFGISARSLLIGVAWHATLGIVPIALAAGVVTSLSSWLLYYGIPFVVVLPLIRLMGEANEHRYTRNDATVIGTTFNNVAVIHYLVHPHGDNFHALHHLHPSIPHHALAKADAWLMANDPDYARGLRRSSALGHMETPRVLTHP